MCSLKIRTILAISALGLAVVACSSEGANEDSDEKNGDGDAPGEDDGEEIAPIIAVDTIDPGPSASGGSGAELEAPPENCGPVIQLIIRDFNSDHPDFEAFNGGQGEVGCGMVETNLELTNGSRTPVFFDGSGSGKRDVDEDGTVTCTSWDEYYTGPSEVTSAASFADWYNNVEGTNLQIEYALRLTQDASTGTYVFDSANSEGFFPLDGDGFNEVTEGHNFHFTTEAHISFGYEAGQKFTFSGDDDLWIFVNGKLALDLGGMHSPISATIDFDAQASALGITPGNTYNMDIFHAERHTSASNFRIETNISCFEAVYVPVIR